MGKYIKQYGVIEHDTYIKIIEEGSNEVPDEWLEFTIEEYGGNGKATCETLFSKICGLEFNDWQIYPITLDWDWRRAEMNFTIRNIGESECTIVQSSIRHGGPISNPSIDYLLEDGLNKILHISKKCKSIKDYYLMRFEELVPVNTLIEYYKKRIEELEHK